MDHSFPRSPFSTALSGSAKAARERIRNLFQREKRRPALLIMACTAAAIALCGGLVAFQTAQTASQPISPQLVMDVQHYTVNEVYLEIPKLVLPEDFEGDTAAVDAINAAMEDLKAQYDQELQAPLSTGSETCMLYPTQSERYLNLVFYQKWGLSSGNDGKISSWVLDKEENRLVTLEEALSMSTAELTEEELCAQLIQYYTPQIATSPDYPLQARDAKIEGFRIRLDGRPVFYLSVTVDDPPNAPDVVDGWEHLFIWESGGFTHYDCRATVSNSTQLVPGDRLMGTEKPLRAIWYFDGSHQPQGGFLRPESTYLGDRATLDALFSQTDLSLLQDPVTFEVLDTIPGWENTLVAAAAYDSYPRYHFVLGVVDNGTKQPVAALFEHQSYGALPETATYDGQLLYTCNGGHQGYTWGEAGLVSFDGADFTWDWPFRGNLRDKVSQAYSEYFAYWENHIAYLIPGGLELYEEKEDFGPYPNAPDQWTKTDTLAFFPLSTSQKEVPPSQLILDCFAQRYSTADRVYLATDAPSAPAPGDLCIDELTFAGSLQTYETIGVAWLAKHTVYYEGGQFSEENYVVLEQNGYFGDYTAARGIVPVQAVNSPEDAVVVATYGLADAEVSLWRDGYPTPAGPGTEIRFFREVNDGPEQRQVWEDGGLVYYHQGDSWQWHSWPDFTALCYHSAAEGSYSVVQIDTTRTDLRTYRGVSVGDSRQKVLECYPEIFNSDYWGKYPGEDYLWYCDNEEGFGAALLFFFEEDTVSRIVLNNMWD